MINPDVHGSGEATHRNFPGGNQKFNIDTKHGHIVFFSKNPQPFPRPHHFVALQIRAFSGVCWNSAGGCLAYRCFQPKIGGFI